MKGSTWPQSLGVWQKPGVGFSHVGLCMELPGPYHKRVPSGFQAGSVEGFGLPAAEKPGGAGSFSGEQDS